MKLRSRNIITLTVVLLFASFSISYSHTILEQIGAHCRQHETHDFEKVMASTAIRKSGNEFSSGNEVPAILPLASVQIYVNNDSPQNDRNYNIPLIFYDKLFITKYRSLLI